MGGGLELLRAALDELRETSFVPYYPVTLGTLAQGLAGVGQVAQALATIDEALAKSERDEERWWIAELLRIKAELVLLDGSPGRRPARPRSTSSTRSSGRAGKGPCPWSCAAPPASPGCGIEQGRPDPARELLAPVHGRFTEGFDTADLRAAKAILDMLG